MAGSSANVTISGPLLPLTDIMEGPRLQLAWLYPSGESNISSFTARLNSRMLLPNPPSPIGNATLTIETMPNATPGAYHVLVSAVWYGSPYTSEIAELRQVEIQITVMQSIDEFIIRINPTNMTIPQGGSGTATVTVTGPLSLRGYALLNATDAPSGTVISFAPNPVVFTGESPSATSTATIAVGNDVPVGNYSLAFVATFPSIRVVHTAILSLTVSAPRCVIATATYGSGLAGPVQFLRDFRDHDVESTYLGRAFMSAFNAWYYSWAPPIAQTIAGSESLRSTVRVIITPLILSLFVAHIAFQITAPLNAEAGLFLAGLAASSLVGLAYLTLPMCLVLYRLRRRPSGIIYAAIACVALVLAVYATISHGRVNLVETLTGICVVEVVLLSPAALARRILF
jgi:hypothetical protein